MAHMDSRTMASLLSAEEADAAREEVQFYKRELEMMTEMMRTKLTRLQGVLTASDPESNSAYEPLPSESYADVDQLKASMRATFDEFAQAIEGGLPIEIGGDTRRRLQRPQEGDEINKFLRTELDTLLRKAMKRGHKSRSGSRLRGPAAPTEEVAVEAAAKFSTSPRGPALPTSSPPPGTTSHEHHGTSGAGKGGLASPRGWLSGDDAAHKAVVEAAKGQAAGESEGGDQVEQALSKRQEGASGLPAEAPCAAAAAAAAPSHTPRAPTEGSQPAGNPPAEGASHSHKAGEAVRAPAEGTLPMEGGPEATQDTSTRSRRSHSADKRPTTKGFNISSLDFFLKPADKAAEDAPRTTREHTTKKPPHQSAKMDRWSVSMAQLKEGARHGGMAGKSSGSLLHIDRRPHAATSAVDTPEKPLNATVGALSHSHSSDGFGNARDMQFAGQDDKPHVKHPARSILSAPMLDGEADALNHPSEELCRVRSQSVIDADLEPEKHAERRARIAQEILDTEHVYVGKLETLVEVFIKPLKEAAATKHSILTTDQIATIFGGIEVIYGYNKLLCDELEKRTANWVDRNMFADVFVEMAEKGLLTSHIPYVETYEMRIECLSHVAKQQSFKDYLQESQVRKAMGRDVLEDYLILPIQRIPRYVLLLEDLRRSTREDHPDYTNISQAVGLVSSLARIINERKALAENRSLTIKYARRFNDHTLITPHRRFIKEGVLYKCSGKIEQTPKNERVWVLFTDMLVEAKRVRSKEPRENDLKVRKKWMLSHISPEAADGGETVFKLNTMDGGSRYFAPTLQLKKEWMSAITVQKATFVAAEKEKRIAANV